jgi:hypothetical protein
MIKSCSNCGKDVIRENSKRNRAVKNVFCNHKCQGEWQRGKNNHAWTGGKAERKCQICDEKFLLVKKNSPKIHCKRCKEELTILRTKDLRTCLVCSEEFITKKYLKKDYCSRECASLAHSLKMRGEDNPNYVDGNGSGRHPVEFNKRLKRKIRNRDNYTCQICDIKEADYDKNLDVHHIDYDKSNNVESNLIALCNSCHSTTNGNRDFWKQKLSNLLNVS